MRNPAQTTATPAGVLHPDALAQVARAVLSVALLWLVSSQGYYAIFSALGLKNGYDDAPMLFAAYYLVWAALVLWLFRDVLVPDFSRRQLGREALLLLPILAGFTLFVVYGLPLLPRVSALRAPTEPPDFMFASAWYYLPKSADIVFQQTLAAALILTAARVGYGLRPIAIALAVAFGGFHLLLLLDGFSPNYVTRFALAATGFGALLPYLYLRLQAGFRWAYSLHWGFYALDATLTHFILAIPPWAPKWAPL